MAVLMDVFRNVVRMTKNADPGDETHRQDNEPSGRDISPPIEPWEFDPDHPISLGYKEDRLGFRSVANLLASSLLTQATTQGMVVSIEGRWGSGKSSLVNLLEGELTTNCDNAPSIVRFEPWLVGDRDEMLTELMNALASAVEMIARLDSNDGRKLEQAKMLSNKILAYASRSSRRFAPVARLAAHLGVPGAEFASRGFEATADALESLAPPRPLPQVKQELMQGLAALNRRIVVIIDDLDRLEPTEAAEIIRLLRAVANFPNVIYVLCYDPTVLASSHRTRFPWMMALFF